MRKREGVDYIPVEAAKLSRVSHRKAEYVSEVNDTVIVLGNWPTGERELEFWLGLGMTERARH